MKVLKLIVAGCLLSVLPLQAGKWTTHFAYNNVTQIAMAEDRVYAISDGSLYSVEKQSEVLKVYNNQSGLHGTGITCIYYDEVGKQLLIGYGTGKIDIFKRNSTQYISELYTKEMTQRKTINNITISGRTAYLSTAFGIQTMDLRENKLVDSYWLRPGGEETEVKDVRLVGDSIYAFTDDSLFSAAKRDNIVDYTVWKREARSSRIEPDSEKGTHFQDASNHWYAGHGEGIVRFTGSGRKTYKPNGPIINKPYYLSTDGGAVTVLAGGRWTEQDGTPGHVMRYKEGTWRNIKRDSIAAQTGVDIVRDFMHIAVDPSNINHYFITSYGTGLYEFQGERCIGHTSANGVITSAVVNSPQTYTRLIGGAYDSARRLWFLNADNSSPVIIKEGETYYSLPIVADNQSIKISIPGDLIIDRRNEHLKWVTSAYKPSGMMLLDDGGTPTDATDDRAYLRREWTNQHGQNFAPVDLFAIMQDRMGRLWMATEQGAAYIDAETDFFTSDAIIQPDIRDHNGENPITTLRMKALAQTPDGHIWIGSETLGVYELNEEATEILGHYTTDNSAMSANGILSLAADPEGHVWIGTAEGLVEYNPEGEDERLKEEGERTKEIEEGSMQRWKLHLSYSNPTEIAATGQGIFAVANGSLFCVDKADDQIMYWNKATGLNGTGVVHIAYDAVARQLIIAYENGQIDLLSDGGEVTQMADISMKAGSIDVTINDICVGTRYSYLAMPFGIIAIQPRRGEVSDTYYIGSQAANVEVEQLVEMGDTLYAFSYDRIYKASMRDNLVDYNYWQTEAIPFEQVQEAAVYREHIYVLAHDSLYRREGQTWKQIVNEPVSWMHASGSQMLVYQPNKGLFKLQDDDSLVGLTDRYVATDAVYTEGKYWLAEEGKGLVRLGNAGDDRFQPEGPMSNFGYHLDIAHDQLYVAPGGRWSEQMGRQSSLSIYDGSQWRGIPWQDTWYYTGHDIRDAVQYAVDNNDPSHFYVATYGTGVFEFKNYKATAHYDRSNSTLRAAQSGADDYYFTRTDGAMMDEQGYLWVMNATEEGKPVHVRTPQGQWIGLNLRNSLQIETPAGIWMDRRKAQWKWMLSQRGTPSLILLDDGGTPAMSGDDRSMARSSFMDQNGNVLTPANFRCFAQDQNNRIWVGTDKGIIIIPKEVDFFSSNSCRRIIIPRNDGTGLGDYLLGDEQINCLAVDGGNRMWIGTANSGLYLIEDDTITVAHFTENNSLLPANNVQSIAIMPKTGEVFVGTDRGIASYRSDASEAKEDMSGVYAYPNPVRPNYGGMISITGLMENTTVNIVDAGGNLVCKTKSHGGTAVWDGKLPDGRRATPGVYTALCNAAGGHAVVKIMVVR